MKEGSSAQEALWRSEELLLEVKVTDSLECQGDIYFYSQIFTNPG